MLIMMTNNYPQNVTILYRIIRLIFDKLTDLCYPSFRGGERNDYNQ